MNARRAKKFFKRQIKRLESDNDLMRKIIADSPTMQELYDLYNKPLNVNYATIPFQEFRAKRFIGYYQADSQEVIECTKQLLANDLLEAIKDYISYQIEGGYLRPSITASIFVGRRDVLK